MKRILSFLSIVVFVLGFSFSGNAQNKTKWTDKKIKNKTERLVSIVDNTVNLLDDQKAAIYSDLYAFFSAKNAEMNLMVAADKPHHLVDVRKNSFDMVMNDLSAIQQTKFETLRGKWLGSN